LPEAPVNVTVEVPATAAGVAVRIMLCGVPGARGGVEGFAVTPVGRPVMATSTVLIKELIGLAVIVTCDPAAPMVMESAVGESVRVKSGGGEMVAVMVVVWESIPEVPVRVSITLPIMAAEEADNVMVCAVPGVSVREAGCAVTPVGKPVTATETMLVKPLTGVALMLIC
jgi:hypothetical protein